MRYLSVTFGQCRKYISFFCPFLNGLERIKPCVLGNGTQTWKSFAQDISRLFIITLSLLIRRTITVYLVGAMLGSAFTPWDFLEI